MTRYEKIIEALDKKHESSLRICKSQICACMGCCGFVGGKSITDNELAMYKSGEMKELTMKCKGKNCKSTNGKNHSKECIAAYDKSITGVK